MNRFLSVLILLPTLIAGFFLAGCEEKVQPGAVEVKRPVITGVSLATIVPAPVESYYETSGTVRAKSAGVIASRTMGTVTSIRVKEGDRVRAGQILVVLDDRDAAQRLAAAEAGVREAQKALESSGTDRELARITHQRYENLYREKVITPQEMDETNTRRKVSDLAFERAEEAVTRARAVQEEARIALGFAQVKAVQSGLVTEKKIDVGSLALPGTPLLTIEDTSAFRLEAHVDERLLGKVKPGMPVAVTLENGARSLKGLVGEVVPAVDSATRSFLIKIHLSGPSLKSGLFGRVLIPEGTRETLLVPRKALVEKGQLLGVYLVEATGVMTYRLIKIGRPYGDQVEVLSGMRNGDRIVVKGLDRAVDGGLVKREEPR